jgi:hypothetical protein
VLRTNLRENNMQQRFNNIFILEVEELRANLEENTQQRFNNVFILEPEELRRVES